MPCSAPTTLTSRECRNSSTVISAQWGGAEDSGVVHQHVEPTMVATHDVGDAGPRTRIGDVQLDLLRRAGDFLGEGDVPDDHRGPAAHAALGDGRAETPPGAGHEDDLAVEYPHGNIMRNSPRPCNRSDATRHRYLMINQVCLLTRHRPNINLMRNSGPVASTGAPLHQGRFNMTSMLRSRRLRRGLTAVTALTLVAAACGGDDDDAADAGRVGIPAGRGGHDRRSAATTAATDAAAAHGHDRGGRRDDGSAGGETPAPAGVSDAEWDAIVAAAQDEGKVTIYSSQGLDQLNDLAERFKDEYGIELEVVRDIDSALIPKVEAEQQTGSGIADVDRPGQRGVVRAAGRRGLVRRARSVRRSMTRPTTGPPTCPTTATSRRRRRCSRSAGTPTSTRPGSPTTPTCSTRSWPAAASASSSRRPRRSSTSGCTSRRTTARTS